MDTLEQDLDRPANDWSGLRTLLTQQDIGSLPVVLGLILIGLVFQLANSNFLTPLNLTNLLAQISAVGTISVGVVLTLLIAEIDLSIGSVSGFTAGIMAVLSAKHNVPAPIAVGAAVLVGVGIGLLQGFWVAKVRVPSFVVTLAGFLGWQGALLYVLGSTGTVNLNDRLIVGIANTQLPVVVGWLVALLFVGVYAFRAIREHQRRSQAGVRARSTALLAGRILLVAAAILVAVAVMNVNRNPSGGVPIRGVPSAVLIFIGFIVVFDFVTRRTRFGRAIYAVGGNPEAARRAGISVDRVRILVLMLSSTLAACGGILAGSRLLAVNQSSGSGDVLLNAIAAAVIGGTSLFGGRGTTWSALLGVLVIGSIANGMNLLAFSSSIRFMVTGAVLLLAVTLDSYTRAQRETAGET